MQGPAPRRGAKRVFVHWLRQVLFIDLLHYKFFGLHTNKHPNKLLHTCLVHTYHVEDVQGVNFFPHLAEGNSGNYWGYSDSLAFFFRTAFCFCVGK